MDLKSDLDAVRVARLRLRDDWRTVLRHAWSIRLSLLAASLTAASAACSIFAVAPPIPLPWFAALTFLLELAAPIARLFAQKAIGDRQ